LYRRLNQENLRGCFYQLRRSAAPGVDKVTFTEYERELATNLADLVGRLKGKRYRAKLVRRKYIPKANGKLRPLGIPALEDKLLQLAAARMLEAIYEQDFLECSWGYRPKRGPREAGRELADRLYRGQTDWVVEADIKGFFDNISHDWMMRMLAERIEDGAFLRLISKWLKAGVLEEAGNGHPAGRHSFTRSGEHLSALRAGPVVRASSEEAESGRCVHDALCGRLCLCLPASRGCGSLRARTDRATGKVWVGRGSRQDPNAAIHPVQTGAE
jgi:group II intron reverse transcriptase/maturase